MEFSNAALQAALTEWRGEPDIALRAEADNLHFETRVSDSRRGHFEVGCAGVATAAALASAQMRYYKTYFETMYLPPCFRKELVPTQWTGMAQELEIVRVESLDWVLGVAKVDFDKFRAAFDSGKTHLVEKVFSAWNGIRDKRPAFAAFHTEVSDLIDTDDWAVHLRDRLGLAHYHGQYGPIPVALMQYKVADVLRVSNLDANAVSFTAPTALDSGPWPYFFPSPASLTCGRTMSLNPIVDEAHLLAEFLHYHIPYKREMLKKVGVINSPIPGTPLKELRNNHLLAVRLASDADDFGEEIL